MSSTDTVENTPSTAADGPDASQETHHNHEGHDHEGHDHAGHDHEGHTHGPVLNPDCTREVVLDVPVEEVAKAYKTVTGQYRKYAKIPGFRAGKTPESVVKRRYANEIRKEVIDTLLPERFNKAVRELGVKPVGQPQVTELTIEENAPLHVKAAFEYIPDFSIDGYQSVTVEKPSAEVPEEEFRQELERMRESRATIEPVEEDRALTDGDWAEISYTGKVAGEDDAAPMAGESSLVEVGGKETMEAFTTALRGSKPGQALKVEVIYPEGYAEPKLAGKTVAYDVEVKAIKKRILPELNDEFAKELGAYESFADLEKRVREYMVNRKQRSVEGETKDKLFTALAAQGMSSEQMRKLDFGRLRTAQRDSAITEVKTSILLDRIAEAENLTVADEELERELQMAALQSGESVDALKVRLTQDGGLARIREQLRREKTANVLYERLP